MLNNYQTLLTVFPSSIKNIEIPFHLSPTTEIEIDKIWQKQQERCQDKLFDGWLFSVTEHSTDVLEGCFIPYRWYVAWLYSPSLRKHLPLCPLGVSGITYAGDQILIGRRAATVADYPLAYECVPSGGVDRSCLVESSIDLLELLKRELFEEANIRPDSIVSIQPLGLVLDRSQSSLEMCVALEVTSRAMLMAKAEPTEYSEFITIEKAEAGEFLKAKDEHAIVPLTSYMWHLWRTLMNP